MKREINPYDYAREITTATSKGVLLNTQANGRFNTMTIGWGTLGREWNKPIFTVYVRTSRFSHGLIEANGNFTVSLPFGNDGDRSIIKRAGTLSGRDIDKVAEFGLKLVEPSVNGVPGIAQFPLTLECRVAFKTLQNIADIHIDTRDALYPLVSDSSTGANRFPHTAYYGEIIAAYIIE